MLSPAARPGIIQGRTMANVDKYLLQHEAIVNQAKALKGSNKRGKGTSPEANKYISRQWALVGGNAPQNLREADPKDVDWKKVKEDRQKEKVARKKRETKKKGFVV
jgi:hypothetical protein